MSEPDACHRRRRVAVWGVLALATISCGSVGDPLPPLANLPAPVSDLAARQAGDQILVSWSWPQYTTEGLIARHVARFTLWAVDVPGFGEDLTPETIDLYRRDVLTIAPEELPGTGPGNRLEASLDLTDWELGQETILVVTVANRAERHAGYSNQARLVPLEPPGRVVWMSLAVREEGVALGWLPAPNADVYAVERSEHDDDGYARLGLLSETSLIDSATRWGQSYRYRVRPLRHSESGLIEGPPSSVREVTPQDRFPPAPPRGLRAVRTASSIELSWLPNPEDDLAGYRVLRAGSAVSPLLVGTTFSYPDPGAGAVTISVEAVDTHGNASEASPPVRLEAATRQ